MHFDSGEFLGANGLLSSATFAVLEHRTRRNWHASKAREVTTGAFYRAQSLFVPAGECAPASVRAAAWIGLVVGGALVPSALNHILTTQRDADILSLILIALASASAWIAGVLLLARAPLAIDVSRAAARASQAAASLVVVGTLPGLVVLGFTPRALRLTPHLLETCIFALSAVLSTTGLRKAALRHVRPFQSADPHSSPRTTLARARPPGGRH
jgi:hypothetical protein